MSVMIIQTDRQKDQRGKARIVDIQDNQDIDQFFNS